MRVAIVGGGKLGYYLAQTLREHGHSPIIIESNESRCFRVADTLDLTVIHGDGTKPEVLESAGLAQCNALIAVTGRDENNLIACQLAKQVFHVKKTVARVNNPKNAPTLKALGVDIPVSSTDNIARLIEREVETAAIRQVLSLAGGSTALTEVLVPNTFTYNGQTLAQLTIPNDVIIISVTRGDEFIIPRGNTKICIGDKILVLASNEAFPTLARLWKLRDV